MRRRDQQVVSHETGRSSDGSFLELVRANPISGRHLVDEETLVLAQCRQISAAVRHRHRRSESGGPCPSAQLVARAEIELHDLALHASVQVEGITIGSKTTRQLALVLGGYEAR